MTKKKPFYGWLIVIGGFLIMSTCYPVFVSCFTLFSTPITTTFHISRSAFNLNSSIMAIVGIFASILIGKILDKVNVKLIGALVVGLVSLDLVGWAFVTQLWQMYALSFLAGFCALSGTRLLVSILVANWFDKRRGLATGLCLMGSGFGGAVLVQVVTSIIASSGWRTSFLVLAAIVFVVSMPLTLIAFHNKPSDIGLKPYGADEIEQEEVGTKPKKAYGDFPVLFDIGFKNVRKTPAFAMLLLGFFFMGVINGGMVYNISPTLKTSGYSAAFIANIISLQLIVVIAGKILLGTVYDRFGIKAGTWLGSITSILATFSLLFPATIGPWGFAVFFGFGTCLGTVAPPIMVVNEFGKKDLGEIVGTVTSVGMIGVAIGSPMMSLVYDQSGSYGLGFILLTVMGLVMLFSLLLSGRLAKKYVAKLQNNQSKMQNIA